MTTRPSGLILCMTVALLAAPLTAAAAEPPPAATLPLYAGVAPGSEGWRQQERMTINAANGGRMVRNVVAPTLEVYRPDPGKSVGLGVIIAPGGGYRFLSWDTEGVQVARWLAARGVTGIVLKYRVSETPADDGVAFRRPPPGAPPALSPAARAQATRLATEDGVRALQLVRQHAGEWGLRPERIGVMGFSAGAGVTVGVVKATAASQPPLFAAPIYGGDFGAEAQPLPTRLPPFFLAVSADDDTAGDTAHRLYAQLRAAGQKPEFHVFHSGGHGWGMERRNQSLDHWIDEFYWWLDSSGFLKPVG